GAAKRYCGLCPSERRRTPVKVTGDFGVGPSFLLVRRGVSARVRPGGLVDACDGEDILDLSGAGIFEITVGGRGGTGLIDEEMRALYNARLAPSLCEGRPFLAGGYYLKPGEGMRTVMRGHAPAEARARIIPVLRAARGLYWAQGHPTTD